MKKLPFILSLLLIGFFNLHYVVHSATVAIDPSHFEIIGKAGNIINGTFKFEADKGSIYQFLIREFDADGTKGQIKILPDNPKFPINKWVQFFPAQITTTSSNPQTINFRITVPESTEERDYYFVILAQPIPISTDGKQTSATALPGVATNVILSLFDKTKAQGDLKITLTGAKVQKPNQALLNLTIQNNLSKFQTVSGAIELTSKITKKKQTFPVIPQNVLSGAVREMTTSLEPEKPPAIYLPVSEPGIFEVLATVTGDNGTKYSSSVLTIIILPSISFLFYPLLTLILLITAIFLSIKIFLKKKN